MSIESSNDFISFLCDSFMILSLLVASYFTTPPFLKLIKLSMNLFGKKLTCTPITPNRVKMSWQLHH